MVLSKEGNNLVVRESCCEHEPDTFKTGEFTLQNVIKGAHWSLMYIVWHIYVQVTQDTFCEKYLGQNFVHLKDRFNSREVIELSPMIISL